MRTVNPVLKREVVERWRSRRAPMTLTVYLALLGGIMYLLYRGGTAILRSEIGFGFDASTSGPVLGRFLVEGLFFFVLLLVLFVGPGYAAAQISGERERRTLTLLQVTLLRPLQIVLGKLGAAVAWLSLLVVTAVPLGAVGFFLGGIGITDLLRGGLMLLVLAVSVAAIGLGISSLTRRTTGSIVLTYGVVLGLTLGTLFLAGAEAIFRATRGQNVRTPIALYANPFFGLADAVNAAKPSSSGMMGLPSPLGLFAEALPGSPAVSQDMFGSDEMVMEAEAQFAPVEIEAVPPGRGRRGRDGNAEIVQPLREDPVAADPVPAPAPPAIVSEPRPGFVPGQPEGAAGKKPVWLMVMGIYLTLGAGGILLATRRLRVTEPRTGRTSLPMAPPGTPVPVAPGAPGSSPGAPPASWDPGQ